ncbi:MAG: ATP synthase subunit I [Burkholderiaceae bacterium]
MNEALILLLSGIAGAALGVVFFGGLWWTVRRGASSAHPALWFLGSLLLRMAIVLAGFYAVAGTHWQRLLLCLLGFALARLAVTRATRATGTAHVSAPTEAGHAP